MIRIFIDFDGTITSRDVGDALFERFGGSASVTAVQEYREGKISAVECFRRECEACGNVPRKALDEFLDGQEIDQTFIDFVAFCRVRSLGCTIVSDGMDHYIGHILAGNGLHDIEFHSNSLELVPAGDGGSVRFQPHFPNQDETCDRCASCKRNHMLTQSSDDDIIVYVGEGYSDRCPVRFADVVFAKDDLLVYCQSENISYIEYRTFSDIRLRLAKMLDGAPSNEQRIGLRKRRQAELARREIFHGG